MTRRPLMLRELLRRKSLVMPRAWADAALDRPLGGLFEDEYARAEQLAGRALYADERPILDQWIADGMPDVLNVPDRPDMLDHRPLHVALGSRLRPDGWQGTVTLTGTDEYTVGELTACQNALGRKLKGHEEYVLAEWLRTNPVKPNVPPAEPEGGYDLTPRDQVAGGAA